MSWVKVDDAMPEHPKILHVGPLGLALHLAAICYCARNYTDGFVPDPVVVTLIDLPRRDLLRLIAKMTSPAPRQENPLWEQVPGGFEIHDYLEYNPSREEHEAAAEGLSKKRARAGRKGARARWQNAILPYGKTMAKVDLPYGKTMANGIANGIANRWQKMAPDPDPDPLPQKRHSKLHSINEGSQSLQSPNALDRASVQIRVESVEAELDREWLDRLTGDLVWTLEELRAGKLDVRKRRQEAS